jgi:hypothetical protein
MFMGGLLFLGAEGAGQEVVDVRVDVRVDVHGAWGCNAWMEKEGRGGWSWDTGVGGTVLGRGVEWWSGRAAGVSGEQPTGALGRKGARR